MRETTEKTAIGWVRSFGALGAAALLLGTSAVSVSASLPSVLSASSISVFVGYADSDRAGGDFPNPWNGAANLTFDGCSPQTACNFDAGAIRIRNDNASTVSVNQVNVHIGTCLYTWAGAMYPVALAPGASLVTTQRASGNATGCTGPNPSTFDSSDIPSNGNCNNDGIQPTVDVTIDGATSSYLDSGQILNTGGIDPGACTTSDESTEWVRIGGHSCPGQTLSLNPPSQTDSVGASATVLAALTNSCGDPLSGVLVSFKVVAGPNVGASGAGTTDSAGTAAFTYSSPVTGTDSLQAAVTNAVGFTRFSNTVSVTWIVEFAPGGGSFVIGNENAALGTAVYFWGAQWAKRNSQSAGPAPRSFKGYSDQPATPACGQSWTSDPGNSTPPPDGPLPALMAVIVTTSASQTGPEISGDTVAIVIVKTDPGYQPNPGHAATGVVVAVLCGLAAATTVGAPQQVPAASAPPKAASGPAGRGGASSPTSTGCRVVTGRGSSVNLPTNSCARKKRS